MQSLFFSTFSDCNHYFSQRLVIVFEAYEASNSRKIPQGGIPQITSKDSFKFVLLSPTYIKIEIDGYIHNCHAIARRI
jgi:hypothetical protein